MLLLPYSNLRELKCHKDVSLMSQLIVKEGEELYTL